MDNKTHMMFHDEDVRAEGYRQGLAEGYRQGLAEGYRQGLAESRSEGYRQGLAEGQAMVIEKAVPILKQMGIPETEIAHKLQQAFDLSGQEIATLLSTK